MKRTQPAAGGPAEPGLDPALVRDLVSRALAEDVGTGDITTAATVDPTLRATGLFIARQDCVLCGLPLARAVFASLDPAIRWTDMAAEVRAGATGEGTELAAGDCFATVAGSCAALLTGERTALNFLQRLSGIATLTRHAVREVEGTRALVLDTRKTTPTMRAIEKYAVRTGGAANHRFGLFDAVLIKDNHVALAGGISAAILRARAAGRAIADIEVEVDDIEGALEAIEAGATHLLLDNFTPQQVAEAVRGIGGRARVEVSGGLRPGELRAYAEAGADCLSIGRLTHSAPAVDISLEVEPLA